VIAIDLNVAPNLAVATVPHPYAYNLSLRVQQGPGPSQSTNSETKGYCNGGDQIEQSAFGDRHKFVRRIHMYKIPLVMLITGNSPKKVIRPALRCRRGEQRWADGAGLGGCVRARGGVAAAA